MKPLYADPEWRQLTPDEWAASERYRVPNHGLGYRCPACLQTWCEARALRRHMAILHHRCRFCPKAYIRVERHERYAHTAEYAIAEGCCE